LQTRSFCFVDDLVEGFLQFMALPAAEGKTTGFPGPMNLGNPTEFTIRELAELVIELTGSASRIVHLPAAVDDPRQRQPDISLAQRLLPDWQPRTPLREGLQRTIAYFDQMLSRDAA